jgi:hypothetical protein
MIRMLGIDPTPNGKNYPGIRKNVKSKRFDPIPHS